MKKLINSMLIKKYLNILVRRNRSSGDLETACPELEIA